MFVHMKNIGMIRDFLGYLHKLKLKHQHWKQTDIGINGIHMYYNTTGISVTIWPNHDYVEILN